ncbi:MAG TPA: HAMP domain-containing sensor histidine kinase, partial [Sphingomonas sp.]
LAELGGGKVRPDALPDEIAASGRTFSLRRSPLRSGESMQRGWILLMADISAIREAERDRAEAIEFLSHDMRSPQAAIITLLEGHEAAGLPRAITGRVIGHARRTLALADDFVQLARLRATRYAPEEIDLSDIVIEAADALWSTARQRGIGIVTEGAEQPHLLSGEHSALLRALINLLDNAVKFSPDKGVVRCAIANSGDGLLCTIEDDGPGMSAERGGRPFDRFGPTEGGMGGGLSSGLGLAYVRSAIERHGGRVDYEPRVPRGARFLITLPTPHPES